MNEKTGGLPPNPYGSPPIYLPFSAVEVPLQQSPSAFISSAGYWSGWVPYAPVVDAGWSEALHAVLPVTPDPWHELIDYVMPAGVQDMIIPFLVEKVSPALLLSGPMIVNTADATPLSGLSFTVTNLSTSLMAIQLNALLDSGNYHFKGLITVVG